MFYDRKGNAISLKEWATMFEGNRHLCNDILPNGYRVSTVWLGLDHSFGIREPLIFETMVFDNKKRGLDRGSGLDMERYHTEEEAKEGHKRMVDKWKKKKRERKKTKDVKLTKKQIEDFFKGDF